MLTKSTVRLPQKAIDLTLSTPVQAGLYLSLAALTLWSVYFTTSPAIHDSVHSSRHHTLMVSCH